MRQLLPIPCLLRIHENKVGLLKSKESNLSVHMWNHLGFVFIAQVPTGPLSESTFCTTGLPCLQTAPSLPRWRKTWPWLRITLWWILWSGCCRPCRSSTSPWRHLSSEELTSDLLAHGKSCLYKHKKKQQGVNLVSVQKFCLASTLYHELVHGPKRQLGLLLKEAPEIVQANE